MEIPSVNQRKDLFINTLLPIAFVENLKILDDRRKYWIGGINLMEKHIKGILANMVV